MYYKNSCYICYTTQNYNTKLSYRYNNKSIKSFIYISINNKYIRI